MLDSFIDEIKHSGLNSKESLYVIIGRNTFSSAVLNAISLKDHAFFIGEPTGGKPIHYGETDFLLLPATNYAIKYSTKYFDVYYNGTNVVPIQYTRDSLYPNKIIEPTINDYLNDNDPVLEFIMSK